VTGRGGVPVSAGAAVLSVTTVDARARIRHGVLRRAAGAHRFHVELPAWVVSTNAVVTALDTAGQVCLYTSADVDRWSTSTVTTLSGPPRCRSAGPSARPRTVGPHHGRRLSSGIGKRVLDTVTELQVAGSGGLPARLGSVILNLTVTETSGPGS
jgi:hypothetical protein